MMKNKLFLGGIIIASLLCLTCTAHAFTVDVDGKLDEWGVIPGPWGDSTWTPKSGITGIVDDYEPGTDGGYVSPGWGGQAFDVEAMYMTNDIDNLYFAIVTGFPQSGAPGYTYIPGDIGLDLDKNGFYEYGICVKNRNSTFYAGNLYEVALSSNWAKGCFTAKDPLSDPTYITKYSSEKGFGGGNLIYNNYYSADKHWVIEGYIPVWAFGSDWEHGKEIGAHWTMSCANDYLNLDYTTTPEPATLSLLGLGILGLLKKFKVKNRG